MKNILILHSAIKLFEDLEREAHIKRAEMRVSSGGFDILVVAYGGNSEPPLLTEVRTVTWGMVEADGALPFIDAYHAIREGLIAQGVVL